MTARAPEALSSAAAAALVVLAGLVNERMLLVVVALLMAFSAANWRHGVPARGTGQASLLAWVVGASAAGAITWNLGPADEPLLPVIFALGVGFLGLIVVQLFRRHPRTYVTSGAAAGAFLLVVFVLGAMWLDVFTVLGGRRAVVVGAVPVAVAALARLLPLPWSVPGALVLGTASGAVLGLTVPVKGDPVGLATGAALGALGGLVVALQALLRARAGTVESDGTAQGKARAVAQEQAWIRATAPFAVFVAAALVYPVLRVAVS